ncbi:MAG: NAD-dependent epimerase/dehydratase family protein, partial [Eubacterium sp.]
QMDFLKYDVIFHVAAIVHKKEKPEMEALYMKVNCELPIQIAEKAKVEGIKQFIFMSSMSVYGINSGIINKHTIPSPRTYYGKSKLEAEQKLQQYNECKFNVAVIRPPMIYGKGSKGNYPKLAKLARRSPIFPDIDNERSMLYIENLCAFIRLMIDHNEKGIFFPQNKEYVKTTELVQTIAQVYGKKMHLTKIFNPLLKGTFQKINLINKVFGSLVYEKELSIYNNFQYSVIDLKKSIELTEKGYQ